MLYTFIFLVIWNFVNKYVIAFLHTEVKQQTEYTHTHTHIPSTQRSATGGI